MTETAQGQTFDEATAIAASGPQAYAAELDPLWTIAGNPNGGYLQAIMARAGAAESIHPHVVAASTHFLSAPRPGKVDLGVEILREGRSTTQLRVRLSQGEAPKAESMISLSDLTETRPAPRWESGDLPAPGVAFDECPRFLPPLDSFPADLVHQLHLHLEPDSLSFTDGAPRGLGELRGWLELPGGEQFGPRSLLLAADVLPPATFDITMTGWVPTLELSTYVRAIPAAGPVQILLKANLIHGGRVDETCTIRDSQGAVVAQAHQLAAIRMP